MKVKGPIVWDNGPSGCRVPTLSAMEVEGSLGEVGVVTAVGFLQLWVSRLVEAFG